VTKQFRPPRPIVVAVGLLLAVSAAGGCGSAIPSPSPASSAASSTDMSLPAAASEALESAGDSSGASDAPLLSPNSTPNQALRTIPGKTVAPTAKPATACTIFPATNVWNKEVSKLQVAANSARMIRAIGLDAYLHPDFDAIGDGIPYNVVGASTAKSSVSFEYADESDAGPYPIPTNAKIEKGSDRHMLMLDRDACRLYELYAVQKSGGKWHAGSGAIWNLRSNALRPAGWTSADAAGLPILPGLVLYSEVKSGEIRHAIRFTAPDTCGYIYPARHLTAPKCSTLPPMGLRVRLKASVDISHFGAQARIVLTALKRYGMILADNGAPWYITGEPSGSWNDDQLHRLQDLHGSDFEVVDTSGLVNG
jgi:hypothetical protein